MVVPSMGRPDYVRRQLRLWGGSEASVLIVDGSETSSHDERDGLLPSNIRYVHLPAATYANRIRCARGYISTRYVALLADDDVFLESGLRAVIARLEADPDAESGLGRTVRFHFSDGEFRGALRYTNDDRYPSVDSGVDLSEYLLENLTRQYSYYAVYRTPSWIQSTEIAFDRNYSSPYVSEIAFHLVSAMRHNGLICQDLCWLRSDESTPVSTNDWNRRVSFADWMAAPEFRIEREYFVEDLTALGVSIGLWTEIDGPRVLREVLDRHAAKTISSPSELPQVLSRLLQRVGRKVGSRIRRYAKPLLPLKMSYSTGVGLDLNRLLVHLTTEGIVVDEPEVRRLLRVLSGSNDAVGT